MKEYFIYFYSNGKKEIKGKGLIKYEDGDILKVNEKEMWEWLNYAHSSEGIEISIYQAIMIADLS